MRDNLLRLIEENSENSFYIDLIQHDLDWMLYHDGEHLNSKNKRSLFEYASIAAYVKGFVSSFDFQRNHNKSEDKRVLSIVPFSLDEEIIRLGYTPYTLPTRARKTASVIKSWKILFYTIKYDYIVKRHTFKDIFLRDLPFIKRFYEELRSYVIKNDFKYLFVRTDQFFLERSLLRIFNEIHKKSFIFLHGVPAEYSKYEDVLSTYQMVWGNQIKNNYINNGLPGDRIKVIGNVKYRGELSFKTITWDDSNILVAPESSVSSHHHADPPEQIDRNRILVYLYEVEFLLKRMGYKHAYYRPHPAFNKKWLEQYVDNSFYTIDKLPLSESAEKCSLVIGATSSVILEYCLLGVNCIVYERNKSCLFPPFDGSDKRLPFASSPDELAIQIKNHVTVAPSFIKDYIQPFDSTVLKKLID